MHPILYNIVTLLWKECHYRLGQVVELDLSLHPCSNCEMEI
jgi:hypothetical protein